MSSNKATYYQILGVEPTASAPEIRKAYLRHALTDHPDKCPDDPDATQRFQMISKAYRILCDDGSRVKYDTDLESILKPEERASCPSSFAARRPLWTTNVGRHSQMHPFQSTSSPHTNPPLSFQQRLDVLIDLERARRLRIYFGQSLSNLPPPPMLYLPPTFTSQRPILMGNAILAMHLTNLDWEAEKWRRTRYKYAESFRSMRS